MADTSVYRGWLYTVLIAIDQLGNALAGGYADSTISARVGYNARHANPARQNYWRLLEWVINYTFLPLDGSDHCYQAYLAGNKTHYRDGSDLMRVILSTLIFFNAMPIAIATRILVRRKNSHQP
ncbi:hypothetical protein ABXT70_11560 [Candidatus Njordibacter sp. Uisw_039]|jgi:hypothetical protein|uniref:hypothetical protein n=1 Tax=Candidatus Njordibacter sp. Uisw_039 TaxID=3230972 RepID=UPI003A1DCC5D|tara:strand:+ start:282 stop:653 length:372 start_codon:yes stop_codon:yes gene_type:complete